MLIQYSLVKDLEFVNLLPQSLRRRRREPQTFYSATFFAKQFDRLTASLCEKLCGSLRLNFLLTKRHYLLIAYLGLNSKKNKILIGKRKKLTILQRFSK